MTAQQDIVADLSRLHLSPLSGQKLRRIETGEYGLASAPGG